MSPQNILILGILGSFHLPEAHSSPKSLWNSSRLSLCSLFPLEKEAGMDPESSPCFCAANPKLQPLGLEEPSWDVLEGKDQSWIHRSPFQPGISTQPGEERKGALTADLGSLQKEGGFLGGCWKGFSWCGSDSASSCGEVWKLQSSPVSQQGCSPKYFPSHYPLMP